MIPEAELFRQEFLNLLKEKFAESKDLKIGGGGGGRPSKGGRGILLKGSNKADGLC